jgi:hypothetical protein
LLCAVFISDQALGQGVLTNGANHAGALLAGETDIWAFPVTAGNQIVLRAGTVGFTPRLEVLTQQGVLVGSAAADDLLNRDATFSFHATNTGVYTVQVRSQFSGGSGTYNLAFARIPSPFVVPSGDEGGALASGAANPGAVKLGDLDMWSFPANAGDRLVLRMGTTNFAPHIELYGPSGVQLGAETANDLLTRDLEFAAQVTNSGTHTVLVSSQFSGDSGTYGLHLARLPGAFLVSPGDQGGALTNGALYYGTVVIGDLDLWSFGGNFGHSNALFVVTTEFSPWLRLYGPSGALVAETFSDDPNARESTLSHVVTTNGTFRLVISARFPGQSGAYSLRQLRVAPDVVMDTNRQVLAESETLTLPLSAQNPEQPGKPLAFSLVSGPAGAVVIQTGTTNAVLSWTPGEVDGCTTNRLVIGVTDTVNGTAFLGTNGVTVVVDEINSPPDLPAPLPALGRPAGEWTIDELVPSTIGIVASDPDYPANPLTYRLLDGPMGLTMDEQGVITWTPTEVQGPATHFITVRVTDTNATAINEKSLSATNTFSVAVREVNNHPPSLAGFPNLQVNPGQVVTVTATASDEDWPPSPFTYELLSGPPGATMSSAGLLNWRPSLAQANTTNSLQILVEDVGPPSLSEVETFQVIVNPLAPVVLTALEPVSGKFRFQVNGTQGPDYVILSSTNHINWTSIATNYSPATPFVFEAPGAGPVSGHLFRVRLEP